MAQVFLFAALLGWATMVFGLWWVAVMLAGWQSAAATVTKSDYTDTDQWQDRWAHGNYRLMSGNSGLLDDEDSRLVHEDIAYTPADGRERHAMVTRRVARARWRGGPAGAYVVWYDQANPDRVTPRGPFYWLWVAAVGGGVMACSVHAMIRLGGLVVAVNQLIGHR
jgi:hypothetical protein